MAKFITLARAKAHLRITDTADDIEIQAKVDEAEGAILRYLKTGYLPEWDADPTLVPGAVTSSILLWLTALYELRGDDNDRMAITWTAIVNQLSLYRDPALA